MGGCIPKLDTRMEASNKLHTLADLILGKKSTCNHWIKVWMDSSAILDTARKTETCSSSGN
jgi:ribulose kinase